jgi:hemoglobin
VTAPRDLPVTPARASFFDAVGGEPFFRRLVDVFYEGVAADPLLRPMYPEEELGPARERLTLFLMQYWGGPNTYSASRGHPRLRMRHAPFTIGQAERDAWAGHMQAAIDEAGFVEPARSALREYFERASTFLINANANPNSVELLG